MRAFALAVLSLATAAVAQNCGPSYDNQVCEDGLCCSQYSWCDKGPAYCDPQTCQKAFSGKGSSCASGTTTTLETSAKPSSTVGEPIKPSSSSSSSTAAPSQIPVIDVCGHAQGGVTCPGAGLGGYFYRCCSSAGHCGPKNDIQDQNLYCGTGCQKGYGKCDNEAKPKSPTGTPGVSGEGETCGPIVNKKCASGLCCSGSNFCGKGADFCGADNWCQKKWGKCN